MSKVSEQVLKEWATKKKHIQDRLNRINKRLKKYEKQRKHFEFRLKSVKEYEQKHGKISGVSEKVPQSI